MRNYLTGIQVVNCTSLEDALKIMAQPTPPTPLAGGTDIMVNLNFKKLSDGIYLNLHSIPELKKNIRITNNEIILSALTTYTDVIYHSFFQNKYIILPQAAASVGSMGIQTRGTWAGNIMNASPAADGVPALMVYDAQIVLISQKGERIIPLCEFYQGYKKMQRLPDELIKEIRIPIVENTGFQYFRKVGERKAQAIAKVTLAARIVLDQEGRVQNSRFIFGSVMPYSYRMLNLEKILANRSIHTELVRQAVDVVAYDLKPITDIRSTAHYRLRVAQNLVEEFLNQTLEKYKFSTAETRRIHSV